MARWRISQVAPCTLVVAVLLVGCGGASDTAPADAGVHADGQASFAEAGAGEDAAPAATDAGGDDSASEDGGTDAGIATEGDAAPRNSACTPTSAQTGTLVNTTHGRLDGTLVYVLPVGGSFACNGDDSHVHLQIDVSGLVYDVAVDVGATGDEVGMYETSFALPDGAWAEGWHGTDALTYSTLGVKATELPTASPTTIAAQVESLLESTSQISVFCTGYAQGDGCHDVHYENGNGKDGAIVLDPMSPTPNILFFRFQGDSF